MLDHKIVSTYACGMTWGENGDDLANPCSIGTLNDLIAGDTDAGLGNAGLRQIQPLGACGPIA